MAAITRRIAVLAFATAAVAPAVPARAEARTHVILIEKMKFGPVPDGIRVGDTITWANHDIFRHTATARDKSFDLDLPAHAEGRVTVTKPGAIAVFCRFHPGMTTTVMVAP